MLEETTKWTTKTFQNLGEKVINIVVEYGVKILLTLLFIIITFKLTKVMICTIRKRMDAHGVDPSVTGFLASLSDIVIKVLILLTAANGLGFKVTSFITILGSAGLAVGLALQGSLSNLAGGVLILLLKPFRVGDYIKTSGVEGTVESIDIFYTRLKTIDNQSVVLPNGTLSNGSITNVTKEENRRIDLEVTIAYSADIKTAKTVLMDTVMAHENVLKEEPVNVFVGELGESGIVMGVRVWCPTDCYWPTRWELLENIKYAFDENDIEIPYTTLDVNVRNE